MARRVTLAMAASTILVAACSSLLTPGAIEVPQARLQAALGKRFPVHRRLLDSIELEIGEPRLSLQPDSDRIAVDVQLAAGSGGLVRSSITGTLRASAGLRLDADDNTVRLADPRIERLAIDGLPEPWRRALDRTARPLAANLLDGQVLYTLRPKDAAALAARGVRPGEIHVTPAGIVITLVPVAR